MRAVHLIQSKHSFRDIIVHNITGVPYVMQTEEIAQQYIMLMMIHVLFRCDRNDFKEVSIEVTARRAFALRCTLNLEGSLVRMLHFCCEHSCIFPKCSEFLVKAEASHSHMVTASHYNSMGSHTCSAQMIDSQTSPSACRGYLPGSSLIDLLVCTLLGPGRSVELYL
jgi:hypothetical protein